MSQTTCTAISGDIIPIHSTFLFHPLHPTTFRQHAGYDESKDSKASPRGSSEVSSFYTDQAQKCQHRRNQGSTVTVYLGGVSGGRTYTEQTTQDHTQDAKVSS